MNSKIVNLAKRHFLWAVEKYDPIYKHFPRHVTEVQRWTLKLLKENSKANKEIVLLAVWLHDIGQAIGDRNKDHAFNSEKETRKFLKKAGVEKNVIDQVAHCVRAHRCKDVQPATLEAKILAAADSLSHMTDVNYIVMFYESGREVTLAKLERDYRDIGLFPKLKEEITDLYLAWKNLLEVLPEK